MTLDKEKTIQQLKISGRADGGSSLGTGEDRAAMLSSFIKFKNLDALVYKCKVRRVHIALESIRMYSEKKGALCGKAKYLRLKIISLEKSRYMVGFDAMKMATNEKLILNYNQRNRGMAAFMGVIHSARERFVSKSFKAIWQASQSKKLLDITMAHQKEMATLTEYIQQLEKTDRIKSSLIEQRERECIEEITQAKEEMDLKISAIESNCKTEIRREVAEKEALVSSSSSKILRLGSIALANTFRKCQQRQQGFSLGQLKWNIFLKTFGQMKNLQVAAINLQAQCSQLQEEVRRKDEKINSLSTEFSSTRGSMMSLNTEYQKIGGKLSILEAENEALLQKLAEREEDMKKLAELSKAREEEWNKYLTQEQDSSRRKVERAEADVKEQHRQMSLMKEKMSETLLTLECMREEMERMAKDSQESTYLIERLTKEKSEMMSDLMETKSKYEQKLEQAQQNYNTKSVQLSLDLSSANSKIQKLDMELNSVRSKRENMIKELRRENGELAEQFMAVNAEKNRFKDDLDRLKEELRQSQLIFISDQAANKGLSSKNEELERELKDSRDKLRRLQSLEDDYKEIKFSKLPEKEQMIEKMSNTLAELNREKVNTFRDVRILYEKYMKLQEECQTKGAAAKEAQSEVEKCQNQIEVYKKIVAKLERQVKTAPSGTSTGQQTPMSVSRQYISAPQGDMEELVSVDNIEKIRQRYGLSNPNLKDQN